MFDQQSIILSSDSYKGSHFNQRPPGTECLFIYGEARKKTPGNDFTLFYGMQGIVDQFLRKPITREDIDFAEETLISHGEPFWREGWERVLNNWGGEVPVIIRAVPEGSVVPNGNVLWTVQSLDPALADMASYIENVLLRVWYPSTVATRSYQAKLIIRDHMLKTCDNLDGLPFKLHDFGSRGVSSGESAGIGGGAHLVNFSGTDTLEALLYTRQFYGCDKPVGFSIPAMEHGTVTSWGRENEVKAYSNMLDRYGKPGAIFAAVSDSYSIEDACEFLWGEALRQKVIDSGATVVIRPDSGNPITQIPKLLAILGAKFGFSINSKGYKVLNHVRLIWGDGLDGPHDIANILHAMIGFGGWSTDNIAFGMGGGLLQKVNRDDLGFASKTSAACINGQWIDVYKDPITDPGKRSKRGLLTLVKTEGGYETRPMNHGWSDKELDAMSIVYAPSCTGVKGRRYDMTEVRQNTGLW